MFWDWVAVRSSMWVMLPSIAKVRDMGFDFDFLEDEIG